MKHKKSIKPRVLTLIHRHGYSDVTKVEDATKARTFEVTKRDASISRRYDHNGCALAVCAKRSDNLDGVIISSHTAYLIKDKKAVRYTLPISIGREVTSFDRGAGFEPGVYQLSAPCPSARLGVPRGKTEEGAHSHTGNYAKRFVHMTGNIRTPLVKA